MLSKSLEIHIQAHIPLLMDSIGLLLTNYDFMVCKVLSYFKEKLWEEVKTLQLEDKVKHKNINFFLI